MARGTATQVDGTETITYEIEATAGPLGEDASGVITRTVTGLSGPIAVAVADVTCLAVDGSRAALIGSIRPDESVNVGYDAQLVQIFDGTPSLQADEVASGTDPVFDNAPTLTRCDAFLPPFPFPTQPITAGDFEVIDAEAPPPPPPPPPPPDECDEDDHHHHHWWWHHHGDDCDEDDDY